MELILYTADCTGNAANCLYPLRREIGDAAAMAEAAAFDHVCALYRKGYRSIENFEESVVAVWDCDNDHSDRQEDWVTPESLGEGDLADVSFVCVPSRSNMKPKGSRSARPRFHFFAEIPKCQSAEEYTRLKTEIQRMFPFFDGNALDAGRFLFGSEVSADDVYWHDGWITIDELLDEKEVPEGKGRGEKDGSIHEGMRHNTMVRFASRVLKRYGDCDKARKAFTDHAEKCDPPLSEKELNQIWGSAVKYHHNTVMKQPDYVPPEEYNADFKAESMEPEDYTDLGEAKILVREYENELKYTKATDYLRYDGDCWREDREFALGAVEDFLDLQLADALDAVSGAYDALEKAGISQKEAQHGGPKKMTPKQEALMAELQSSEQYLKFVLKCRNYKNFTAVQNAARPMFAIDVNGLDKDPNLINTPKATYDMRLGLSGEHPHDPNDLITKMTECSPGDAGKKLWDDALQVFFCENTELIEYVQMTVGQAAVGSVNGEQMIIAYGDGANGKSTFWNAIYRVLGDYSGRISAEALTMNCKRNVKPEMAELKGKRLIIASELEEGMRLNTATVKQLCSTDEIQAEKKYKAPFAFKPSHMLVLYTNHLPRVGANDDGIWRRLIVIPFDAKITGKSDIKNYGDYLFRHAGEYIMRWIIEGAKKAIDADFHIDLPKVVEDAIEAYREENNWLGHFLEDCCKVGEGLSTPSGKLYDEYRAYALRSGEYARSKADFYGAIELAGFRRHKTKKGAFIDGLELLAGRDFL